MNVRVAIGSTTLQQDRTASRILRRVGQDRADDGTGADHSQAKALVRPTFTQRANKRFPFVLGAFLILNLVQVLKSGSPGGAP